MDIQKKTRCILDLQDLKLELFAHGNYASILSSVNFKLDSGETIALIGESGSGKSMTALSIMQLIPRYIEKRCSGQVQFDLKNFSAKIDLSGKDNMAAIRGKGIAMIFQDPNNSFNPIKKCGEQIVESVLVNTKLKGTQAISKSLELINLVGLGESERMYKSYPHELSGGQLQRLLIAMAIAGEPEILIADEATSNLDQESSLEINLLLKKLQKNHQFAMLYITHDMEEAKLMADRYIFMDQGKIVEDGKTNDLVFEKKMEDQSQILKDIGGHHKIASKKQAELLRVEGLYKSYGKRNSLFGKGSNIDVLKGVDLQIAKNQIVGLSGLSGSGKSTLARIIMNLEESDNGKIIFNGERIDRAEGNKKKELRKKVQLVYQNPFNTLNPRMSLTTLVKEVLSVHGIYQNEKERRIAASEMLLKVGIEASKHKNYTYQLSGGQRQRVAIARCLILQPELLILDESISSLDRKTQIKILELLFDLKEKFSLSYLFISHDQSVIKSISDTVFSLQDGKIIRI